MNRLNVCRISLGLIGIPLLIGLWESLPTMDYYQWVMILIAGILYNTAWFSLPRDANVGKGDQ